MLIALSILAPAHAGGVYLTAASESADFVPPSILVGLPGAFDLHADLGHPPEPGITGSYSSEMVSMQLSGSLDVEYAAVPAGSCGNRADLVVYPIRAPVELPVECAEAMTLVLVPSADPDVEILLDLVFESSSPTPPGSTLMFNPQPEPPGMPFSVGFEFRFERPVDVLTLGLSMTGPDGRVVELQ